MAFIRWKRNSAGNYRACLILSYRDAQGKPRHKMLAHLGDQDSLTPERISALRDQYPDLKIDWGKIQTASRPRTYIAQLSDAELLRKLRELRHERGWTQFGTVHHLYNHGMPRCSGSYGIGRGMGTRQWGALEKALERGEPQDFFLDPENELAPIIRKAF
jgi:hypothetical protein